MSERLSREFDRLCRWTAILFIPVFLVAAWNWQRAGGLAMASGAFIAHRAYCWWQDRKK